MKKWRAKHPEYQEYLKEYSKVYLENPENREKARLRATEWRKKNPERKKQATKDWYDRTKTLIGRPVGDKHRNWKGEEVGYDALHTWVVRWNGKAIKCEHCKRTDRKKYEWANISREYKRDLQDWIQLCTSCHRRYDYGLV